MKTTHPLTTDAAILAQLLERLEHGRQPDAEQYRMVSQRLAQALDRIADNNTLDAVLQASPAAAELYENMHYQHAGLCRALLDVSLTTERSAREAIARAMRPATEGSDHPRP
ncbi:MAG: hypothetical protein JWQ03_2598 [Variovorax sp.]|nr:hypothetical protein [Variovorax sp.]